MSQSRADGTGLTPWVQTRLDKTIQMHIVVCEYCNMQALQGHTTEDCKRRQTGYTPMKDIMCYKCERPGHKHNNCPNVYGKGPQRTAALQVIEQNSYHGNTPMCNDDGPHNCDESRGDGEVTLACGCMLPVVAGAISREEVETHMCRKDTMQYGMC